MHWFDTDSDSDTDTELKPTKLPMKPKISVLIIKPTHKERPNETIYSCTNRQYVDQESFGIRAVLH